MKLEIVKLVRLSQLEKVESLIAVTELGKFILDRYEQFEKALVPIVNMLEGIEMLVIVEFEKPLFAIALTGLFKFVLGITMLVEVAVPFETE